MILLCGSGEDAVTRFLSRQLSTYGVKHQLLDLSRYPVDYLVTNYRSSVRRFGSISWPEGSIQTDELTGVFTRNLTRWDDLPSSRLDANLAVALHAEKDLGLESLWMGLDCAVVNRFGSNWSNHSKPYQTLAFRGGGLFEIPKTLISNDLVAMRSFYEEADGQVIYKAASGLSFGTVQVTLENLESLLSEGNTPIQLQQRVTGVDIRVHVVSDQVFATRVRSGAIDYRRAGDERVHLEAIELPVTTAAHCIQLTKRFGLLLSGIDLKETPDGRFYCFEVNTCPDFAFYEQSTGQPISGALRDLLSGR
jgi:hypothetical protein